MPLCDMCRSEAEIVGRENNRIESHPPHGMDWGEQCDRCDATAEVTIDG